MKKAVCTLVTLAAALTPREIAEDAARIATPLDKLQTYGLPYTVLPDKDLTQIISIKSNPTKMDSTVNPGEKIVLGGALDDYVRYGHVGNAINCTVYSYTTPVNIKGTISMRLGFMVEAGSAFNPNEMALGIFLHELDHCKRGAKRQSIRKSRNLVEEAEADLASIRTIEAHNPQSSIRQATLGMRALIPGSYKIALEMDYMLSRNKMPRKSQIRTAFNTYQDILSDPKKRTPYLMEMNTRVLTRRTLHLYSRIAQIDDIAKNPAEKPLVREWARLAMDGYTFFAPKLTARVRLIKAGGKPVAEPTRFRRSYFGRLHAKNRARNILQMQ